MIESSINTLYNICDPIEKKLVKASKKPIIGSIPAALLIVVGAIETAVATVLACLSLLFSCFPKERNALKASLLFMGFGITNIVSGAFRTLFGSCADCFEPRLAKCSESCCGDDNCWTYDESEKRLGCCDDD